MRHFFSTLKKIFVLGMLIFIGVLAYPVVTFNYRHQKNLEYFSGSQPMYLNRDKILEKKYLKHQLMAGKYTAVMRSARGIFYLSPKKGFFYDVHSKKGGWSVGGIYLPTTRQKMLTFGKSDSKTMIAVSIHLRPRGP